MEKFQGFPQYLIKLPENQILCKAFTAVLLRLSNVIYWEDIFLCATGQCHIIVNDPSKYCLNIHSEVNSYCKKYKVETIFTLYYSYYNMKLVSYQ